MWNEFEIRRGISLVFLMLCCNVSNLNHCLIVCTAAVIIMWPRGLTQITMNFKNSAILREHIEKLLEETE